MEAILPAIQLITIDSVIACRLQNPNIPCAVQVGAAHGGGAERGGAGQNRVPIGRIS